jgi:alkylation response protein AidB-like acyl-CoA dehydrogenase
MMNVAALSAARTPGPENAIVKLVASGLRQEIATFAAGLQGPAGILVDNDQPHIAGLFQKTLLCAPGGRIAGGTDEIQRNIIAERLLGLPADAMIDKDTPFNRLPAA